MNLSPLAAAVEPASRFANPFATCWTRPGAMPWIGEGGASSDALTTRLVTLGGGQIIGPHGVGKSTLLAALAERMADRAEDWLVLDGAEQLSWFERRRLTRRFRRGEVRPIVTTHRRLGLPVLVELRPSRQLFERLFESLIAHHATPVTLADAAACYDRYGPNLREVWFALYDRHHRLTAAS
ncbi:MAG: hypothetical protein AAGJ46_21445 [Planctomycetota bacterium]